jgi:hypothetical protein
MGTHGSVECRSSGRRCKEIKTFDKQGSGTLTLTQAARHLSAVVAGTQPDGTCCAGCEAYNVCVDNSHHCGAEQRTTLLRAIRIKQAYLRSGSARRFRSRVMDIVLPGLCCDVSSIVVRSVLVQSNRRLCVLQGVVPLSKP